MCRYKTYDKNSSRENQITVNWETGLSSIGNILACCVICQRIHLRNLFVCRVCSLIAHQTRKPIYPAAAVKAEQFNISTHKAHTIIE